MKPQKPRKPRTPAGRPRSFDLDKALDAALQVFWRKAYVGEALKQPTARTVTEKLLRGAAELLTDPHHPSGCLMVQAALVCGEASDCIRKELVSRRLAGEAAVRRRFKRAIAEGDLPADSNPADLARYVVTISQGMAVQAASGASREQLRRVVGAAMRAWPR